MTIDTLSFRECVKFYGNNTEMWKFFENKENPNFLMNLANRYSHYELMIRAFELGATNYEILANNASFRGDFNTINVIIQKYSDLNWNELIQFAQENNHTTLITFFVSKGGKLDYNYGLCCAAKRKDKENIDYHIKKCNENNTLIKWNLVFHNACVGGSMKIVKFFMRESNVELNTAFFICV